MTEHFEWEEKDEETPFFLHMIGTSFPFLFLNKLIAIAGSFAGVTEHCLLLPFDNLKVKSIKFSDSIIFNFPIDKCTSYQS